MILYILLDGLDELASGFEYPSFEPVFGKVSKESFYHIQPGRAGGGEMKVEALVSFFPCLDLLMLVSRVVIANDMDLFIFWGVLFERIQKPDPLLMAVFLHAASNHFPIGYV